LDHDVGVIPSIGSTLSALVDPAALLLVFLVLAAGLCVQRRNWLGTAILTGLAILIEVTLGTTLPRRLIADLEAPYTPDRQPLPARADAIVMLGGAHEYNPREMLQIGFIEASDRILTSIELLRQGRAGTLVLCSAGAEVNGKTTPDSEFVERLVDRWNLRRGQVLRLPIGRNTADEAREVSALASRQGWKRILLVTSGFHLRRAEATFRKAGMEQITPVGCDFRGIFPGDPGSDQISLPRTESATTLKMWLHEQVGWWYYGFRGWR
jgi:uncharacterized SAM-binding protein YcdF (DUF218 family)